MEYAARILKDYKKYRDTAFERLRNWIAEGEDRGNCGDSVKGVKLMDRFHDKRTKGTGRI